MSITVVEEWLFVLVLHSHAYMNSCIPKYFRVKREAAKAGLKQGKRQDNDLKYIDNSSTEWLKKEKNQRVEMAQTSNLLWPDIKRDLHKNSWKLET